MLFNFFKKSEELEIEEGPEILAKLSYIFTKDNTTPIVDVEISEYNDECMHGLLQIINTIGEEKAYLETINIIKEAMIKDNQEGYLINILTSLGNCAKSKIINAAKEEQMDQLCIKPSEMII